VEGGGDPGPQPRPSDGLHVGTWGQYALAVAFGLVGVAIPVAILSFGDPLGDTVAALMGLSALAVPIAWYGSGLGSIRWAPWIVFVPALALSVTSVVSGFHNGLTDEPYAMPAFAGPLLHGHNPYSSPVSVTYNQYGVVHSFAPTYVYLPVLIFLQPFVVPYKWFAVASWAVAVYLLRSRPVAVVAFGQGTIGLLAASGFNDFPVLLLLTLGVVGIGGRRQRWAELLSLGCKQFANVFLVVYYVIRRDLRRVLVTLGVSVAFILPFLLWNAHAFVCQAVLLWPPGCGSGSSGSVFTHTNYWIWPVWGLGVFFVPIREFLRGHLGATRSRARSARAVEPEGTDGLSSPGASPVRGPNDG
jgi:hypothetical protein